MLSFCDNRFECFLQLRLSSQPHNLCSQNHVHVREFRWPAAVGANMNFEATHRIVAIRTHNEHIECAARSLKDHGLEQIIISLQVRIAKLRHAIVPHGQPER